jgi:hypothetical protein
VEGLLFLVKSLAEDGLSVSLREIDLCALGACCELPYQIERYFLPADGAVLLPLTALITTRARPKGIANAASIMRATHAGQHARRAPISVRSLHNGDYVVEDGNSTLLNAIASAWPQILCLRQSTA